MMERDFPAGGRRRGPLARVALVRAAVVVAAVALMAGCGGGDGGPSGPTPNFSLAVAPGTIPLAQGSNGTAQVTLTRTGGFTGPVSLSVTGVPTGAMVTPQPASMGASATTAQLAVAAGTASEGNHTITVTGEGGGITRQATFTLTVQPRGSFTLSANPAQPSIQRGAQLEVAISIAREAPFAGPVNLSVEGAPAGLTGSFTPNPATGAQTTLTLAAAQALAPGDYPVTVRGTGGTGSPVATFALTVTVTAPPPAFTTFHFCPPYPLWVAYQDGVSGPWVQAAGANGTYTVNFDQARGGIAWVEPLFGLPGSFNTRVVYGSRDELLEQSVQCAAHAEWKTVHAAVAGLAVGEQAAVSLGAEWRLVAPAQLNMSFPRVGTGPLGLLASRNRPAAGGGPRVPDRLIVRRGLEPANGSTLSLLDFNGDEAVAPETATVTFANSLGRVADVESAFLMGTNGAGGRGVILLDNAATDQASRTFYGVPAALRQVEDLHQLTATTFAPGLGAMYAGVSEYIGEFGNRTLTFGPPPSEQAFTIVASTPYVRPRLEIPVQPEYARYWQVRVAPLMETHTHAAAVTISAGYHDGSGTVVLELPDFSAVPGWSNAWGLPKDKVYFPPGVGISWVSVIAGWDLPGGISESPVREGASTRTAGMVGTLFP